MIAELAIVQGIFERGLIFSLIIMAMYLTSRIIRFDDLTVEGSFGLGGALMALLLTQNTPWWVALPLVIVSGASAGLATGLLHTKLKLNNLISGIVVTTALFSINLKIAGSHITLGDISTIFHITSLPLSVLIILTPLTLLLLRVITWFLNTEIGFLLTAVGDNPQMLSNLGKNAHAYKILALMIANSITALSGALFVQYVGYFSIWTNVGMLIVALAGLILAESFGKGFGIHIIGGALAFQSIIAATFELNIDQDWNKLITALLIVLLIAFKKRTMLIKWRKK